MSEELASGLLAGPDAVSVAARFCLRTEAELDRGFTLPLDMKVVSDIQIFCFKPAKQNILIFA
jgi:hypothetical protein